jgi:hypothetical protein
MKQVPFNQDGLDSLIYQIKNLKEEDYKIQLNLIQFYTRKWVLENFILNDDQVEYVNLIPKEIYSQIGLFTKIGIENNTPIKLEIPDVYAPPITSKRRIEVYIEGGGTYAPGEYPSTKDFEIGIRLGG